MAIGANSYGSVAEVEALTRAYTASGSYTTVTQPTLAQVEKFIDRVSAYLNMCLAKEGFAIPVTQADSKLMLDDWATKMASDLCHLANNAGPFAQSEETRGAVPSLHEQACTFIGEVASGLEDLGASRSTSSLTDGMGYRTTTDSGDAIEPLFSRSNHEWMAHVVDWDAA